MSVLVIVEIQAKPENVSDVKALLAGLLPGTRAYDGCQRIDAYSNTEDSGNMVFVDRWDSRAHFEKYLAWRTETGSIDRFGDMLSGPPSIRYFEKADI